jgi:hypothetical protein
VSTTLLRSTSLGAASSVKATENSSQNTSTQSGPNTNVPKALRWAGNVLTALILVALAADITFKLIQAPQSVQGTVQLGYPTSAVLTIGLLQLVCFILYVIPATAPVGAILFTGYFGGAVATHLRIGNPLLTHILSGVYVSAILWFGLYTRDARVRALVRPRRASSL